MEFTITGRLTAGNIDGAILTLRWHFRDLADDLNATIRNGAEPGQVWDMTIEPVPEQDAE